VKIINVKSTETLDLILVNDDIITVVETAEVRVADEDVIRLNVDFGTVTKKVINIKL
jgi:hypothetical protein